VIGDRSARFSEVAWRRRIPSVEPPLDLPDPAPYPAGRALHTRPYAHTPLRLIRRPALGVLGHPDLFSDGRKQILDSLAIREIDHEGW